MKQVMPLKRNARDLWVALHRHVYQRTEKRAGWTHQALELHGLRSVGKRERWAGSAKRV